jgi:hypothetical protein
MEGLKIKVHYMHAWKYHNETPLYTNLIKNSPFKTQKNNNKKDQDSFTFY